MKTFTGSDGKPRCAWSSATPKYVEYHDQEWGMPTVDDRRLFEKLCLEGFQSGLSWRTILSKRENFRRAFSNFEVDKVARFGPEDVERLLGDAGIVRHRGKIEAAISNARAVQEVTKQEGSLGAFIWRYEPAQVRTGAIEAVATSVESVALSKELKKRGFKFVGPTTVYAFMQAMGLVNDHAEECFVRRRASLARKALKKPS